MIMLVAAPQATIARYAHPNLGRLFTPRLYDGAEQTVAAGVPWAADNDAFNAAFDEDEYRAMLARLRGLTGGLFVVAPDVVYDARATLERFERWRPELDGLPVALAAQDGMRAGDVPWEEIDALFIGGGDRFKLGPDGERLACAARERGRWLHVGRVNSYRRIRYCATIHADSVDGSQWPRWPVTHMRNGLAAVAQPRQPRLGEVA